MFVFMWPSVPKAWSQPNKVRVLLSTDDGSLEGSTESEAALRCAES